jgi:glutamate dehydrogenase
LGVALARRVAALAPLAVSLDLAELRSATGRGLADVASAYFRLGAELQLDWLQEHVTDAETERHWTLMAKAALRDEFGAQHRRLVNAALRAQADAEDPADVVAGWLAANQARVQRCLATPAELRQQPQMDVAMLTVALHYETSHTQAASAAPRRPGDRRRGRTPGPRGAGSRSTGATIARVTA